jgi:hypothetical protein
VRSGVNARAGAATYQSSRSVGQRVPIGTPGQPQSHCSNLIMLITTGHRRMDFVRLVPVRKLASSQQSSFGCATSLRTAIKAPNP